MTTREEAAEQLRLIRGMMERATIFRALSGETALVGGAVSLGVAWLSEKRQHWEWAGIWIGGLVLVLLFYAFQLWRMKAVHSRPFWSTGLKTALRGALPSLIAGGFLGLVFVRAGNNVAAASLWITHYGLALLAIREFAPKSMVWLGWAFVAFGLFSLATAANIVELEPRWLMRVNASRLMAIAFGGFHLVYGGLIVTTSSRRDESPGMIDFSQLDKTIHEKGRLSIMTLLASRAEPWAFQDLKGQLDMSDGNLITHLRTLEKAGFIDGEKQTGDGRPQTIYQLTPAGRKAFEAYLAVLEQILGLGR